MNETYGRPLRDEFGIQLQPVYLNATFHAVDQVTRELAAGNTDNGSVDLIWINGENFATMKANNLLFGPFANRLPLSSLVDWNNSAIAFDFGVSVDFMESVWSQAQFQFVYHPLRTAESALPRSFTGWLNYARANPGRLSYIFPNRGDFLAARLKRAIVSRVCAVFDSLL